MFMEARKMVSIPEYLDPTLEAINKAIESEQELRTSKNIGFGEIGHECSLYLWNKIHCDEPEINSAESLRRMRNGQRDEVAMAEDLRKVPGVVLYTNDPNRGNKQYKVDFLDGRLTGRLDGVIIGIIQAPKTYHTWEHKAVDEKKFNVLQKEKDLKKWNPKYNAQVHLGMLGSDLDRAYFTVSTPGLRQVTALRVSLEKEYAKSMINKAERIIEAKTAPEKIGGADYYICKICRFYNKCHGVNK